MFNRQRNKIEAKLLQPLVTVLRLLLTEGWSELEGNVIKRKGTKSWHITEKNIVPHLKNIRDLNNNTIFSKVCVQFTVLSIQYLLTLSYMCFQDKIHLAAGILDTNCFDLKCDQKVRIL